MAYLSRHWTSKYAFAEVTLVLRERERQLDEAQAQIREADEVADGLRGEIRKRDEVANSLRDEIRAHELSAAEAEAEIRRAADTEARLQAEIREWQRRAVEARRRLRAEPGGRDSPAIRSELGCPVGKARDECDPGAASIEQQGDTGARGCRGSAQIEDIDAGSQIPLADVDGDVPCPSPTRKVASPRAPTLPPVQVHKPGVGFVNVANLSSNDDKDAQAEDGRREEALQVFSSKRKELLASSKDDDNEPNMLGNFMAAASDSKSGDENGDTQVLPETSAGIGDAPEATVERDAVGSDLPGVWEHGSEDGDEDIRTVQDADEDDDYDTNMLAAESDSMSSDENDDVLVNVRTLAVIPPRQVMPETSPDIRDAPSLARVERGMRSKNLEVNDMDMFWDKEPNTGVLQIEWGKGGELDDGCEDIPTAQSVSRNPASQGNAVPGSDLTNSGPEASSVDQRPVWKLRKTGMFYKMVAKSLKEKEMERASENYRCWLYAPRSSRSVNMEDPDPEAPQK